MEKADTPRLDLNTRPYVREAASHGVGSRVLMKFSLQKDGLGGGSDALIGNLFTGAEGPRPIGF